LIGLRTISGVASKAYFAPQLHWTFIKVFAPGCVQLGLSVYASVLLS
jgi:hypothetical protein